MRESERRGQARKSLWIETGCPYLRRIMLCGQARKSLWIETHHRPLPIRPHEGQARKSLWIETLHNSDTKLGSRVRLVRACGSKPDASPWLPGYLLVRLVRACGSKPHRPDHAVPRQTGQARKSLWIETGRITVNYFTVFGQARKSLWIETPSFIISTTAMWWSGS